MPLWAWALPRRSLGTVVARCLCENSTRTTTTRAEEAPLQHGEDRGGHEAHGRDVRDAPVHGDEGEGDEGGGDPDEPVGLERGECLALILSPHLVIGLGLGLGLELGG